MKNENDLVLFRNYDDPLIAQFHKAVLEEHGIPSVLKDLGFNFPTAIFNDAHAGIKLLVRHRDLQSAFDLMAEDDDFDFPDPEDSYEEIEGETSDVPDLEVDDEVFEVDDFGDDDDELLIDENEISEGFEIDENFDPDDLLEEPLFDEDLSEGFEIDLDEDDDLG